MNTKYFKNKHLDSVLTLTYAQQIVKVSLFRFYTYN